MLINVPCALKVAVFRSHSYTLSDHFFHPSKCTKEVFLGILLKTLYGVLVLLFENKMSITKNGYPEPLPITYGC